MKEKFKAMNDFGDVANLLEIPKKILWKILMGKPNKGYFEFEINKKGGNKRVIEAPQKNLAIIQKKLNQVLTLSYKYHHASSHGFVNKRSIITNASIHKNQRFVFNLDLENFFGTIGYPRVRGLFMSYFKFNNSVASTLANICCNNKGFLPQGAATSPLISNMICRRLDQELNNLARRNKFVYTRYADDITFSTNEKVLPATIVEAVDLEVKVGEKVKRIIEQNGFLINKEKTRLSKFNKSQVVTGIKVNEKLNVQRSYVRNIRSILYKIETNMHDLKKCEDEFNKKYPFRRRQENKEKMFPIIRGMISYIGQVKGKEDAVFQALAKRYNKILKNFKTQVEEPYIKIPLNVERLNELNCFVIEPFIIDCIMYGEDCETSNEQGTGFLLKNVGFVTNAHVFRTLIRDMEDEEFKFKREYPIKIHNSKHSNNSYYAKIKYYDVFLDIAILEVENLDIEKYGFNWNGNIISEQPVSVLGYPSYNQGNSLGTAKGKILNEVQQVGSIKNQKRFRTTAMIYGGNSGGPVVNDMNEVVGVATRGISGGDKGSTPNEIIPIVSAIEVNKQQVRSSKNY